MIVWWCHRHWSLIYSTVKSIEIGGEIMDEIKVLIGKLAIIFYTVLWPIGYARISNMVYRMILLGSWGAWIESWSLQRFFYNFSEFKFFFTEIFLFKLNLKQDINGVFILNDGFILLVLNYDIVLLYYNSKRLRLNCFIE